MVDGKTAENVLPLLRQRLSSGRACLSDFAQEWGEQEGKSAGNYLVGICRGEWLAAEMQHAVRRGALKVFDSVRNREREFRPDSDEDGVGKGYVRLLSLSVNAWLAGEGLAQIECEGLPAAPCAPPEAVVSAPAGAVEPLPVTTGDVAFAFAGLKWEDEGKWKKPLGAPPKWLSACRVSPGRRGVCEATWNPVSIGASLVHAGHAAPKSVRSRFQTKPQLMPWLEKWKDYEATHLSDV